MEHERVDGILTSDESEHFTYRRLLVELAAKTRIPTIYAYRRHVILGGLMAYSFDAGELARVTHAKLRRFSKALIRVTCPLIKRPNSNSSFM
jgi:hypothetical protein